MDDDDGVRSVLCRLLAVLGIQTVEARNGEEALACWHRCRDQDRPLQGAILDLTVPGELGGVDVARRLKALDPGFRCVVSSGYWNEKTLGRFQDHGFVDSLPKPYSLAELSQVLERSVYLSHAPSRGSAHGEVAHGALSR